MSWACKEKKGTLRGDRSRMDKTGLGLEATVAPVKMFPCIVKSTKRVYDGCKVGTNRVQEEYK